MEGRTRSEKYASRGGMKLEGALADFSIETAGRVCLDVGASTGGFTDCLLQQGAARVYAVDVNVDQLAWKLRKDERVIRVERNARELRSEDIPERVDLIVVDVSFISAGKVLRAAAKEAQAAAALLLFVEPQVGLPRAEGGACRVVGRSAAHE